MIIVLGSVQIKPDKLREALGLSLQHVNRSRSEPGCIEHGVYQDSSDPAKLVFVEKWESMALLQAHFALAESRAFVKQLAGVAAGKPTMSVFEANQYHELRAPDDAHACGGDRDVRAFCR